MMIAWWFVRLDTDFLNAFRTCRIVVFLRGWATCKTDLQLRSHLVASRSTAFVLNGIAFSGGGGRLVGDCHWSIKPNEPCLHSVDER